MGERRIKRLTDAPKGSQNALPTPQVAPSILAVLAKWHPHCALICRLCVKIGCLSLELLNEPRFFGRGVALNAPKSPPERLKRAHEFCM